MNGISMECASRRHVLRCALALWGSGAVQNVLGQNNGDAHTRADHCEHMAIAAKAPIKRSETSYRLPVVPMLDQHGRKVVFSEALDDGRPVIMNFVFTSCTTVCPVMTQIFAEVQARLGAAVGRVHMVSVSIDPQYDTPARLLAYARDHGAGAQWDFYTGSSDASMAVQKAFDAYRGDKMNHAPLTMLRAANSSNWVRLDGFVGADEIVSAYRAIVV